MCVPTHQRRKIIQQNKKVWNEWLDERDEAPGKAMAEWLKAKTQEGLEVAVGYAQATVEVAKARAEVALQARALLDEGGSSGREALRVKELCRRAVDMDADVAQRLRFFANTYREEASFATAAQSAETFSQRSQVYSRAMEVLGDLPPTPEMTLVERDAMTIIRLEQATALVGRQLSVTPSSNDIAFATAAGVGSPSGRSRGARSASVPAAVAGASEARRQGIEMLLADLFRLQDLNGNGVLEEEELIKLNEKIAVLHYGKGTDKGIVREKFTKIFRERLDPQGRPVPYSTFRTYMLQVLGEIDPELSAQEMILEQFVAEAESARSAFTIPSLVSASDAEFIAFLAEGKKNLPAAASASTFSPSASATPSSAATATPQGTVSGAAALPRGLSMADRVAKVQGAAAQPERLMAGPPARPPPPASVVTPARPPPPESVVTPAPRAEAAPPREGGMPAAASGGKDICGGYAKGDRVQVYSNSKKEWLDGRIEEAFEVACEAEGYSVPAGTLKVSTAQAIKWIRPGQASEALRRPKSSGGGYPG